MKKIIFYYLMICFVITSCDIITDKNVRGNGDIKSETRNVGSFDGVDVSGAIDVYVKNDSVSSVRIETDANLLELVDVHIEGGALHVHERDGFNLKSTRGVKVYVTGREFSNFDASGACHIYSENKITSSRMMDFDLSGASTVRMDLNAPNVEAQLSGACTVTLKGETKNVRLDGSGASKFYCYDLLAETVSVDISGAGNADVYASVHLDVHVSGAGSIKYKGNASVNQSISGAGSVKKVE